MGTASRSSSELPEVMLGLEGLVLAAERLRLRALHGKVCAGQVGPRASHEHGVGLQGDRAPRARRSDTAGSRARAARSRTGRRVDEHGLAGVELARDAVEPGREQSAEREVGIRRRVRTPSARHWSSRRGRSRNVDGTRTAASRLSGPHAVGAAPEVRLEPAVRVDAGHGEREQGRQVLEDTGDERPAERAKAMRPARIVQRSAARRVPQAPVDVRAVAGLVRRRASAPARRRARAGERHAPEVSRTRPGGRRRCERRRMADRQLLLAVAELRIVLLDRMRCASSAATTSSITGAAMSSPMVEKHRLASSGAKPPSGCSRPG